MKCFNQWGTWVLRHKTSTEDIDQHIYLYKVCIIHLKAYERRHDKANKMSVRQERRLRWHPPSLISLRCLHEESLGPYLPNERTAKTLIRLANFVGFIMSGLIYLTCNVQSFSFYINQTVKLVSRYTSRSTTKPKQSFEHRRPAKDVDQLAHVWSVFTVCMKKQWVFRYPLRII